MNFLGMGAMEIGLILIVAFVFLGPERLIDAARFLGNAVKEGRRLASEMPRIVVEDDEIKMVNASTDRKTSPTSPNWRTRERDQTADEPDGPVAFSRPSEPRPEQPSDETRET